MLNTIEHPYIPVLIASRCAFIHSGMDRPTRKENPMMNRLRDELRSTYWRLEIPTATIKPEMHT